MSSLVDINNLPDGTVAAIFKNMPLREVYDVATKRKRFEDICLKLWATDPMYGTNYRYNIGTYEDHYKFFLCKNALNFHSLHLSQGVFQHYSADVALKVLPKLKQLSIYSLNTDSSEPDEGTLNKEFFNRCPALKTLCLPPQLLTSCFHNIMGMKSLKSLRLQKADYPVDSLIRTIIQSKATKLKALHTFSKEFPPMWLSNIMENCHKLVELVINYPGEIHLSKEVLPKVESVKRLAFFGISNTESMTAVTELILNCPKLNELVLSENDFEDDFVDYILMKREERGITKELTIFVQNITVPYATYMDFL